MRSLVPVLPCYKLRMTPGTIAIPPEAAHIMAVRMIREHLVFQLAADGFEVGNDELVARGCMLRVRPGDETDPRPVVELTFPHPGGTGFRDIYEVTPTIEAVMELVGGPDDGDVRPTTNLAPERLRAVYYGGMTDDQWANSEGNVLPVPVDAISYTRTGYDLATGHWHYSYQGG